MDELLFLLYVLFGGPFMVVSGLIVCLVAMVFILRSVGKIS